MMMMMILMSTPNSSLLNLFIMVQATNLKSLIVLFSILLIPHSLMNVEYAILARKFLILLDTLLVAGHTKMAKYPTLVYESHWFQEEMTGNGSNKRRRLDLNKLFKGNVPTRYVRRHMKLLDFAELALDLHKKEQDAEFELVEALGLSSWSAVRMRLGVFLHINFTAKQRNANCTESDNVSPKLFFAELYAYGAEQYKVAHCSIVEPNDPGVTYECKLCTPDKKISHPIEYQAVGAYPKGFQHEPVRKTRYTFVQKYYTKGSLGG